MRSAPVRDLEFLAKVDAKKIGRCSRKRLAADAGQQSHGLHCAVHFCGLDPVPVPRRTFEGSVVGDQTPLPQGRQSLQGDTRQIGDQHASTATIGLHKPNVGAMRIKSAREV